VGAHRKSAEEKHECQDGNGDPTPEVVRVGRLARTRSFQGRLYVLGHELLPSRPRIRARRLPRDSALTSRIAQSMGGREAIATIFCRNGLGDKSYLLAPHRHSPIPLERQEPGLAGALFSSTLGDYIRGAGASRLW